VSELQEFLISKGYLQGKSTGTFFAKTVLAVKAFQKANGLAQTGTIGPQTRALIALQRATPPAAPAAATAPTSQNTKPAEKTANTAPPVAVRATSSFDFNPAWKDAVVNLFCTDRYDSSVTSGSGVIIDPRGVILTNAHVAENNLFSEWPNPSLYTCVVRTGSPASPLYKVRLLYIPEKYVTSSVASGYKSPQEEDTTVYGEHDYALLYITGPLSDMVKMPEKFPYVSISSGKTPGSGEPVYLVGYGAGFLWYEAVLRYLHQIASSSFVSSVRPIAKGMPANVMLFKGNLAGQHGASGGGVFTKDGSVSGLLTFIDQDTGATTSDKVLAAISTEYILSDFAADTGTTIPKYLEGDLAQRAADYLQHDVQKYVIMYAKLWKSKHQTIPGFDMFSI
jgi:peptidoglycan hydrolase-like protein with peptidoglycan-binding domain